MLVHFCLDENCEDPVGLVHGRSGTSLFLVLIQIGSHPSSFALTFEFEQIRKVQSRALMEPLTFTWFPPKIINFAPFTNGRSYSKRYAFQMALTEVIFKSREEDDPNSSDFSRTQSPDIQLTFSEIHGGNSAQRKKSEQGFEPPHGIFLEKIWIHSFYDHPEIHLHWAFQPWVKHSRLFGCNCIQKMPFPYKKVFSHSVGSSEMEASAKTFGYLTGSCKRCVLGQYKKTSHVNISQKIMHTVLALVKKIDNEKQRNLWTFRNFHKYPQRRWLHIPNQIPQRHAYSSRSL